MNTGKQNRLKRILKNDGRSLIVPIDHGLTYGPIVGLDHLKMTLGDLSESKFDSLICQKGVLQQNLFSGAHGKIVHISGSTSLSGKADKKVLVGRVEDAVRLGADGVSVHVSVGSADESLMLEDLGTISSECESWGLPLLAMMYVNTPGTSEHYARDIAHIARVAAELGADLVKAPYTGNPQTFEKVVRGCFIPVLTAGGDTTSGEKGFLNQVKASLDAGAAGVCAGRNVFQCRSPRLFLSVLDGLIHRNQDPAMAYEAYQTLLEQKIRPEIFTNSDSIRKTGVR